jgi:hypothetical protein
MAPCLLFFNCLLTHTEFYRCLETFMKCFIQNLLSLEKKYVCMWISFILLTVRLKGRILNQHLTNQLIF